MDFEILCNNDFWKKKLRKAFENQDVDKDGFISRADYDLIISRYKEMGASERCTTKLQDTWEKMYKLWGITDHTVKFSIDEMIVIHGKVLQLVSKHTNMFDEMFDSIDMNGNGEISFTEWDAHYKSMTIPSEHARASFDAMDTNRDGIVSKQEFYDYHIEFFLTTEDKLNSSILFGPLD